MAAKGEAKELEEDFYRPEEIETSIFLLFFFQVLLFCIFFKFFLFGFFF